MKQEITFWKNTGHEALRGKTVELFKVSWDEASDEWVRDEAGPYWGMYQLDTENVRRLTRDPEDMGEVAFFNDPDTDALVAEDISVTPEGLDLGEEE